MSKITSKYQVTIPKAIAKVHNIEPGTEIQFESAGEMIRVRVPDKDLQKNGLGADIVTRLSWFDEATARQEKRNNKTLERLKETSCRGWTRNELYAERIDS